MPTTSRVDGNTSACSGCAMASHISGIRATLFGYSPAKQALGEQKLCYRRPVSRRCRCHLDCRVLGCNVVWARKWRGGGAQSPGRFQRPWSVTGVWRDLKYRLTTSCLFQREFLSWRRCSDSAFEGVHTWRPYLYCRGTSFMKNHTPQVPTVCHGLGPCGGPRGVGGSV